MLLFIAFRLGEDAIQKKQEEEEEKLKHEREQETWYHEGSETLKAARLWIASKNSYIFKIQ